MKKRDKQLADLARRFGRRVERARGGHFRLICERGKRPFVVCSSTPTNVEHWLKNVERDLRRNDCSQVSALHENT